MRRSFPGLFLLAFAGLMLSGCLDGEPRQSGWYHQGDRVRYATDLATDGGDKTALTFTLTRLRAVDLPGDQVCAGLRFEVESRSGDTRWNVTNDHCLDRGSTTLTRSAFEAATGDRYLDHALYLESPWRIIVLSRYLADTLPDGETRYEASLQPDQHGVLTVTKSHDKDGTVFLSLSESFDRFSRSSTTTESFSTTVQLQAHETYPASAKIQKTTRSIDFQSDGSADIQEHMTEYEMVLEAYQPGESPLPRLISVAGPPGARDQGKSVGQLPREGDSDWMEFGYDELRTALELDEEARTYLTRHPAAMLLMNEYRVYHEKDGTRSMYTHEIAWLDGRAGLWAKCDKIIEGRLAVPISADLHCDRVESFSAEGHAISNTSFSSMPIGDILDVWQEATHSDSLGGFFLTILPESTFSTGLDQSALVIGPHYSLLVDDLPGEFSSDSPHHAIMDPTSDSRAKPLAHSVFDARNADYSVLKVRS